MNIDYFSNQKIYVASRKAIVNILSARHVRSLTTFKFPSDLQQRFKEETKKAYGTEVQPFFYEIDRELLELMGNLPLYQNIAKEIDHFINK